MHKAIILTVSDSCAAGQKEDVSGKLLLQLLTDAGFEVISKLIIPDDKDQIIRYLSSYATSKNVPLVITIGGTGIGPKDVTPEATREVIEKEIAGISELMRYKCSLSTPQAYLSRAIAGIKNQTLFINFPGSPKVVQESFDAIIDILFHALSIVKGEPH